jgi:hypothetical protein
MASWFNDDTVLLDGSCPLPLDLPFTAAMAATLGVSHSQLRRLLARGLVRRVCRGAYAVSQAPDDLDLRARALSLVVSPSAVITDRTAAWLHGVDVLPRSALTVSPPISVFQRPGTRSRRDGVISGERMLLPRDIVEIGGLAVTSPLRTALDLGRLLWRYDALGVLDQFCRRGVTVEELEAEVERFKGMRGVVQLRFLVPLADPRAESLAEGALRLHWLDAGLPKPELQWWVYDEHGVALFRLDLALPEVLFAAEYDGAEFHSSDRDRAYDLGRRTWLADCRCWLIEVFVKDDLYRLHADPARRLQAGLLEAKATLASRTSYPTLRPAPRRK